ncbi:hypothetical protein [Paraburkholderia rhizosphaerae]|uniref:hypothetical protein n=1 Tax=Paraburkholderia rhizosphaerae TaxID=480658 RepID=UPI001066EE3C|nr:hypothetical protein [Paraburkholderia rhizosphaerae]
MGIFPYAWIKIIRVVGKIIENTGGGIRRKYRINLAAVYERRFMEWGGLGVGLVTFSCAETVVQTAGLETCCPLILFAAFLPSKSGSNVGKGNRKQ